MRSIWLTRVAASHPRTFAAAAVGLVTVLILPSSLGLPARAVLGWDMASAALLGMAFVMFMGEGSDDSIARHAADQQEGEWTVFAITLAGVAVSFVALTVLMHAAKDMPGDVRNLYVGVVAATLLLSWLVTHIAFALRYAHEYYETDRAGKPEGGLEFPSPEPPDYWDFVYFALVLGMTFQVSDVQITSRKLRRLATLHGLVGFLFNTVIVALTVNIAASLL